MKKKLYQIVFWASITAILVLAFTPHGLKIARHMSDKINHFTAFFILAFLGDRAFEKTFLSLGLYLMGFGLMIEAVQFLLPYRSFAPLDMVANLCGILVYAGIIYTIESVRGKPTLP
jgi:VanZ family protein